MAIIDINKKITNKSIINSVLNSTKFLVRVPTASIMTPDELRIKGMDTNVNISDTRNLNAATELAIYKNKQSKKKNKSNRRDTAFDEIILDSSGEMIGSMPSSSIKNFIKRRRKSKVSRRDKIVEDKTEIYLTISDLLIISKDGFTIKLLNNEDLKVMYTLVNDTLDKIENSLNVSNTALEKDLKVFLEEMTKLNTVKLHNDFKEKENTVMDDMFGTDIFMTSPAPSGKKYNIKDLKV